MILVLLLWSCLLVIGLVVLAKASDRFTDAAEKIGLSLRLSPFLIGVTIVTIGTSLPELVTSIIAASMGNGELVTSTVVGANIARILFVLGIAAVVGRKLTVVHELISVDLPFLLGSMFLMTLMIWNGTFSVGEAIICLLLLVVYFSYTAASETRDEDENIAKEMRSEVKEMRSEAKEPHAGLLTWLMLAMTALFIYFGARLTVWSLTQAATTLSVSTHLVAIVALGLGTSLPELSVAIAAARHHKAEIAVGNLLGGNIVDTLLVMGLPALLFGGLAVPQEVFKLGLPVMVAATFLYLFITQDRTITKWEGSLLLLFYLFFLLKLLGMS